MRDFHAEEKRESLARWQERKANGGIKPGDMFHWTPYPKDWIDSKFQVRIRCTICDRVGSNNKMSAVEVVDGGALRCWDADVIASLGEQTRSYYERNTLEDGRWDENDGAYMGWWYVGSECAKHIDPTLFPPKEIQDKIRKRAIEFYTEKAKQREAEHEERMSR